jgi:mRNA interferase MazF
MKNSIVLVPFPFDDFSDLKVRPALCLTTEIGKYKQIVVAFISSNINNSEDQFDILIKLDEELSDGTGLFVDSVIKLHRIVTIPRLIIKRKLGEANPTLAQKVNKNLINIFDLNTIYK